MKILFLSFSDFKGGANIAAYSIFKSLKKNNFFFFAIYSKYKKTKKIFGNLKKIYLIFLRIIEKVIIKIFLKKKYHQSLNIFDTKIIDKINNFNPEIVNIHWINRSMISLNEINKLKSKIVISLHDMWFLNSTEHYSHNFKESNDIISQYCMKKKNEIVKKKNIFFIAHNKWMMDNFIKKYPNQKSKIFLCKNYPIDTKLFKPRNKKYLRKKYNLPFDKKIVFFSAQDFSDHRKGYNYFLEIVQKLKNNKEIFFLSLGKKDNYFENLNNLKQIDFLPHTMIADLYSLSDIFLCTSLIDNLPLTVLEALSSGNVVLSFKNGGVNEILKNIGYTYNLGDVSNIIKTLKKLNRKKIEKKSKISRNYALKNLSANKIREQYINIFNRVA